MFNNHLSVQSKNFIYSTEFSKNTTSNKMKISIPMKHLFALTLLLFCSQISAQNSEDLIPRDAVTVFSLNNITLLQKISLDELVQYEFMEEVQSELFDGSTSGKTIKDAGIDFDQKLNVFYGKRDDHEVSGFTFGIKNKVQLFTVFDDFDRVDTKIPGIEYYTSLSNHLVIKGNIGVLMRVEPLDDKIIRFTDSIWYARGNDSPWFNESEGSITDDSGEVLEEEEFDSDLNDSLEFANGVETEFPEATENPNQKNYNELKDSVLSVFQKQYLDDLCTDLFVNGNNLKKSDPIFANQLLHKTEGIFYMDNSRNFKKAQDFWYIQSIFPSLFEEINALYTGNVMLGDFVLNNNYIELKIESNYGPELGSIYEKLNDSKFDKSVLKYIHESSPAHFTYNVNLREAYEQAFKVIIPILEKEKDARLSNTLLTVQLLNEFIDKDALFDTYKGSMFGTFNGVKKVKTTKIEFQYDEKTFDYTELKVEGEEEMPLFAFGISTDRPDIPNLILKHIASLTSQCKNYGNYWKFDNVILECIPLFIINKNGLLIITNDEDLALNHSDGYGKAALSGKAAKQIKSSGLMYSYVDWSKTIEKLPREIFTPSQNEILDAMRQKTGIMEVVSSKSTKEKTTFDVVYNCSEQCGNSSKYILDLINSIYVLTK